MAETAPREDIGAVEGIVLRRATHADVPRMVELARIVLAEGLIPRTEAFWRWKHERNPFGPSPAMVAEVDGRIVSLRVFLRWRWLYGNRALGAVRPVDTATHPDWRRRGLFERLTRTLVEAVRADGTALVFNTPNPQSGQGYQKLGWRIVGRPTIWVRPEKPARLLKNLARRRGPQGAAEVPQPDASAWPAILDLPDLPAFLGRTRRSRSRLITDSDGAYLAWRYRDCPGLGYGVAGAFDRASGVLIVFRRMMRQGLRELRLCELFVADDRASRSKVREVIGGLLREHHADLVTARAVPGTAPATVLLRSGFVPVPRLGPTLAVRPLIEGADLPAFDRLSSWGASIGDLEVF